MDKGKKRGTNMHTKPSCGSLSRPAGALSASSRILLIERAVSPVWAHPHRDLPTLVQSKANLIFLVFVVCSFFLFVPLSSRSSIYCALLLLPSHRGHTTPLPPSLPPSPTLSLPLLFPPPRRVDVARAAQLVHKTILGFPYYTLPLVLVPLLPD